MTKNDILRRKIIRRLTKMQLETQQILIDKRSWNENRLDAQPFDLGWDIMMLRHVDECIEAWARNDMEAVNNCYRRMVELNEVAFDSP